MKFPMIIFISFHLLAILLFSVWLFPVYILRQGDEVTLRSTLRSSFEFGGIQSSISPLMAPEEDLSKIHEKKFSSKLNQPLKVKIAPTGEPRNENEELILMADIEWLGAEPQTIYFEWVIPEHVQVKKGKIQGILENVQPLQLSQIELKISGILEMTRIPLQVYYLRKGDHKKMGSSAVYLSHLDPRWTTPSEIEPSKLKEEPSTEPSNEKTQVTPSFAAGGATQNKAFTQIEKETQRQKNMESSSTKKRDSIKPKIHL